MDARQNGRRPRQRSTPSAGIPTQRFSWQTPPPSPPQVDADGRHQAELRVNANRPAARHFSYAATPVEHRSYPRFDPAAEPPPQSPTTPIDLRPQSVFHPIDQPASPSPSHRQSQYPLEKNPHDTSPPPEPHPATFAPIASAQAVPPAQEPAQAHARQPGNLSPMDTSLTHQLPYTAALPSLPVQHPPQHQPYAPLCIKTPVSPSSPPPAFPQTPNSARKSHPTSPYSPHNFATAVRASSHGTGASPAIFVPDAATGPNGLSTSLHQPGQIGHPNMDRSAKGTAHEWKHALCECGADVGTCFTGLVCPCVLYGRTSYRLSRRSAKKDPTDLLGFKRVNTRCGLMAVACGLWCALLSSFFSASPQPSL